jgi:hypothetical protein
VRCGHACAGGGCAYEGLWFGRCYWHDKVKHGVEVAPNGGVSDDLLAQLLARDAVIADRQWARYQGVRTLDVAPG